MNVQVVFQNALNDPNEISNLVANVKCREIFCGLNNRMFLKVKRLDQNTLGSCGGRKKSVAFSIISLCLCSVIPTSYSMLQNCALLLVTNKTGGKFKNICKIMSENVTWCIVCENKKII
jgi:hypothetical protein